MKSYLTKIKFNRLVLLCGKSECADDILKFWNGVWIPNKRLLEDLNRWESSDVRSLIISRARRRSILVHQLCRRSHRNFSTSISLTTRKRQFMHRRLHPTAIHDSGLSIDHFSKFRCSRYLAVLLSRISFTNSFPHCSRWQSQRPLLKSNR